MTLRTLTCAALLLCLAPRAWAQEDPFMDDPYQEPTYQEETYQEPYQEPYQEEPTYQEGTTQRDRIVQISGYLSPQLYIASEDIGAGIGGHLRAGLEFGMLVVELELGTGGQSLGRINPTFNQYITGGVGARLQFLGPSAFVPYLGVGAGFQIFANYVYDKMIVNPRAYFGGGFTIELSETFGIEVALRGVLLIGIPGAIKTSFGLQPLVGLTFYR